MYIFQIDTSAWESQYKVAVKPGKGIPCSRMAPSLKCFDSDHDLFEGR